MTPPAAAAAATRARVATPAPRIVPPRPTRRVSGPARTPATRARPREQQAQAERGLVPGLLGALDGISRSGALDRLIRGRVWIAVIAFALIGIVTLQLLVLQLNASIGRSLVREAQLQRENAALSVEGSELSAGERVEAQAAELGMQLVPEGALRFLPSDPRADIGRAAAALKAPMDASGSGEGGAAAASGSSTETDSASSAASTPASAEQAAASEASASTSTPPSSPTSEGAATEGETGAPSSEAAGSSAASAPSAPSSAAPSGAAAPSEAPAAAVLGGAGGVAAGQSNGVG